MQFHRRAHRITLPGVLEANPAHEASAASRMIRTLGSLATQQLRIDFVRTTVCAMPIMFAVRVLENVCARASQGIHPARVAMVALLGMVHDATAQDLVMTLRLAVEDDPDSHLCQLLCANGAGPEHLNPLDL